MAITGALGTGVLGGCSRITACCGVCEMGDGKPRKRPLGPFGTYT
jgi:hypothetical protein